MSSNRTRKGNAVERSMLVLKKLEEDESDSGDELCKPVLRLSQASDGSNSDSRQKNDSSSRPLKDSNDVAAGDSETAAQSPNSAATFSTANSAMTEQDDAALQIKVLNCIKDRPHLLHWAEKAHFNVEELMWHQYPGKQRKKITMCLPVRRCHPDEATGLELKKNKPPKDATLVQYIGYKYSWASQLSYVSTRQLSPLVDFTSLKISSDKMTAFLDSIKNQKEYDRNPSELMLERYILAGVVQTCVEKKAVLGQGNKCESSSNDFSCSQKDDTARRPNADGDAVDDGGDKDNEGEGLDAWRSWEQEERDTKQSQSVVKQPPDSPWDTNKKRNKKQTLRKGCIIEYDEPNSIAGQNILRAEVWIVDPQNADFVLELSDGGFLRREDRCKLIQKTYRGKLVPNDNPIFQQVARYMLMATKNEEQLNTWGGMEKVEKIKQVMSEHQKDIASNPETAVISNLVRNPNGKTRKQRALTSNAAAVNILPEFAGANESPGKSQKKYSRNAMPISSSSAEDKICPVIEENSVIAGKWWFQNSIYDLEEKAQALEAIEDTKKKRRKPLHMSVKQLRLAQRVRQQLATKSAISQRSVDDILKGILEDWERTDGFETVLESLQRFLLGDERKILRPSTLEAVANCFEAWLKGLSDGDSQTAKLVKEKDEVDLETQKKSSATQSKRSKHCPMAKRPRSSEAKNCPLPTRKESTSLSPKQHHQGGLSSIHSVDGAPKKSSGQKRPATTLSSIGTQSSPGGVEHGGRGVQSVATTAVNALPRRRKPKKNRAGESVKT